MSTGGRVGSRLRVANFDPAAKLSHRHTERYQNELVSSRGSAAMLDSRAVAIANRRLWATYPELRHRQLSGGPGDAAFQRTWMSYYRAAARTAPRPPQPRRTPKPAPPLPSGSVQAVQACSPVAGMTHEQKMVLAMEHADLPAALSAQFGSPAQMAGELVVGISALALVAGTGIGAAAEVAVFGTAIAGAAVSGFKIGQGIVELYNFWEMTRCDRAQSMADISQAGKSLAKGVTDIGIGSVGLVLSLLGNPESEDGLVASAARNFRDFAAKVTDAADSVAEDATDAANAIADTASLAEPAADAVVSVARSATKAIEFHLGLPARIV